MGFLPSQAWSPEGQRPWKPMTNNGLEKEQCSISREESF